MEVSTKKVKELLKAIGIADVEIVDDADDKDVSIDDLVNQVDANRSAIIEPQVKDAVKTELEAGIKARIFGTVKAAFNRSGIKLTEEYASVDDMVKKALVGFNDKFSQDAQKLRDDMEIMIKEHEAALSTEKEKYEKELADKENKFTDRDIEEILQTYLKEIPRIGGDELIQAKEVKRYLQEKYHVAYEPSDRKIQIMQKDKPEHPVFNEQKTSIKDVKDVVKEWCDSIGITAKDTRHNNPSTVMNGNAKPSGAMIEENAPKSGNPIEMNDAVVKSLLGN